MEGKNYRGAGRIKNTMGGEAEEGDKELMESEGRRTKRVYGVKSIAKGNYIKKTIKM